ncbi:MAG: peptidylprolyl isomerase [Acidobacteriota bacterium]|jgi:peptidyl-prolyl cis-trans isomerase D|nr:peptidylprolyl isomerase [Acidobacteriota bacterium]
MLDLMRRKKRLKLILWLVIAALALSMLIFFVPGTDMGGFLDNPGVVASVDGRDISAQDFSRLYRRVAERYRTSNNIDEETVKAMGVPQSVLDELVNYEVMEVLARRFGLGVSEDDVRRSIETNPNLQVDGKFVGVETYKALLGQNGYTPAEFEKEVRRLLLHDKVRDFVTSAITVGDAELRDAYERATRKVQVDYVMLKKDDFKKRVTPTDADVKAWFEAHKGDYVVKEKRRAECAMVPFMQFVEKIQVTDEDIRKEWNSLPHDEVVEAAHILLLVDSQGGQAEDAEVKKRAEEVLQKVRSGEDFAGLAQKFSEDAGSAEQGGYLGPFPRGQMVPEFENAAFALQAGEVSDLVRTDYGYHIIKVLRHETPTLESSRGQLQTMVMQRKVREMTLQKAEDVVKAAAGKKDFKEAVKDLGFVVEVADTGLLDKDSSSSETGLSANLRDDIFSLKEIGSVGKPVEEPIGYAVAKLAEVQLPRPGTLEEFTAQATQDYVESKAKELLDAEAQKLSDEGIKSKDLAAAAKALGLEVKKSQEFTQTGTPDPEIGANTPFNQAAFALEQGAVSAPQPMLDNSIVFQVTSRSPFDEETFKQQEGALRTNMLQNLQDTYFQEYVKRAREEMLKSGKIKIHEQAVERAAM